MMAATVFTILDAFKCITQLTPENQDYTLDISHKNFHTNTFKIFIIQKRVLFQIHFILGVGNVAVGLLLTVKY
jgi:hypothetical protein